MRALGSLKFPFIAGCAALLVAGLLFAPEMFAGHGADEQRFWGLVVAALCCVVLYAVMRAMAERR